MKVSTLFGILLVLASPALAGGDETIECRVQPKFSSRDNIAQSVIDAVRQTRNQITLALYGFNNPELADELAKLAKKNVSVRLKIDTAKSAEKKTNRLIDVLKASGVHIEAVAPDGRNHNKFAVIDGVRVLTGSYNWTAKAETNWENLLILECPSLAQNYETEWEKIH